MSGKKIDKKAMINSPMEIGLVKKIAKLPLLTIRERCKFFSRVFPKI